LLQANDVSNDARHIDCNRRRKVSRRASVTAEGSGDLIQPVNLGKNSADVVIENAIEVYAGITPRALKVLDAESDGGEWILDLVRDLSGHLSPCQHTLGASHFDSTQLEVPRQASGGDSAEPESRQRAGGGREQHEHAKIPPSAIENQIVTPRRSGENVALVGGAEYCAVAEQDLRRSEALFPDS
jgi:hypothetical protein